jgi:hypothetical protein
MLDASSTSGCRCVRAWRIGGPVIQTPNLPAIRALRPAWNKGRIVGQKRPLKPKHVWAMGVRLELAENHRDLALFNLAIDSKLRGCDLVKMKVVDVIASCQIKELASVLQSKTQKPFRLEISEGARASLERWMQDPLMVGSEYLWPAHFHEPTLSLGSESCSVAHRSSRSPRMQGKADHNWAASRRRHEKVRSRRRLLVI